MRYLSICSGIEAASVAWHPLGWRPLAFSEIEAFPRAVLKHHYPDVPLHGDFTQLRDQPIIVDADLLVGGTPCQAFSIAGLRQSLSDDRGNLSLEFIRLADAIDDLRRNAGRDAAWILWENVPGVLSVSDNAFGAFLGGLVGSDAPLVPRGRWADAGVVAGPERVAAWRILDAQHFGLAQRRRRVFVLARGGPRGWACADALLPIIDSLSGNPAPRREAGQRPAAAASGSTAGGGLGTDFDCDGGLQVAGTMKACKDSGGWSNSADHAAAGYMVPVGTNGMGVQADQAYTLEARAEVQAVAFALRGREGGAMPEAHEHVSALRAASGGSSRDFIAFDKTQVTSAANRSNPKEGDPCHPLAAGAHPPAIAGAAVRRLTPAECEKLQGFPVGYTAIPWRGRPADECPDGPRYKALGNSMAVPVMRYIFERIAAVEASSSEAAA